MDNSEKPAGQQQITLGQGLLIYLVGIIIIAIAAASGILGLVIGGYLVIGLILNRFVLRGLVEWHPVYDTIQNVATAKMQMFNFWPLRYPILFWQLLVNRHL